VQAALDDEACEWQIWSYAPILVPNDKAVDPLSLWLSLQGATDDRVQLALDELERRVGIGRRIFCRNNSRIMRASF
jgi:hypothetical protein